MHQAIRVVLGAIALAGLVVACGGDDEESAASGGGDDVSTGGRGDAGGMSDAGAATGGTTTGGTGGTTGGNGGDIGDMGGSGGDTGGTGDAGGEAGDAAGGTGGGRGGAAGGDTGGTITAGTGGTEGGNGGDIGDTGGGDTGGSGGDTGGSGGVTGGTGGTTGGSGGATGGSGGATGGSGGTGADIVVAEWTDGPGVCPAGMPQQRVTTAAELEAAARGEDPFAGDAPGTCYLIADGTYASSSNVLLWATRGGTASVPRYFVGESRDGVVINARATIEADHVVIQNVTFDLTGYVKSGSFNTISIEGANDTTIDHVTLTGDCRTGSAGGHIELNGSLGTVVDSCIVEYFGNCGPDGHLDHGIYLASTQGAVIRNSVVRGNASRGIQFNTQQGEYGTIDGVVIENNRIYQNGHAEYEDGIAINGEDTGTIANVTIQHNLIYDNYYSGLRFVGAALSGILVEHNTFAGNGSGSSSASRSEVNLDDDGSGARTTVSGNIFAVGYQVLNDCYSAAAAGFSIEDNVVSGDDATGDCISGSIAADPQFEDAAGGDYHPNNAAVAGYGAYP